MQSVQQLDIFADSRDVMLRNDVVEQLQRRDATAAHTALERLAGGYPDDDTLPAMIVLVRELGSGSTALFADHAALASARGHLEDEVVPAARRVLLAQDVHAWLAPCWSSLAQRAATLPFRGDADSHAGNHAAPLWLTAGEWTAACDAVERIESSWRIPAPLALLIRLGDASLDALRRRFDAEFPGSGQLDDYAWFPAWLLVVKPALAGRLGEARVRRDQAASRATALLGEILRREHEGDQHELVSLRQKLSRLHAGLFDAYMGTRKVQHR